MKAHDMMVKVHKSNCQCARCKPFDKPCVCGECRMYRLRQKDKVNQGKIL